MAFLPIVYKNFKTSGQALLVVLLAMSVVLTLVLSVVARSVTDVSITSYSEDSVRAFDAAEAGVEQAIVKGGGINQNFDNGAQVNAFIDPLNPEGGVNDQNQFLYPVELSSGESATFWFVSHDANGNLTCSGSGCYTGTGIFRICWGSKGNVYNDSPTPPTTHAKPAIELSIYYDWNLATNSIGGAISSGDFSNVKVSKITLDPNGSRRSLNNFGSTDSGQCTIANRNYQFRKGGNLLDFSDTPPSLFTIPPNCSGEDGCLLMARVRMLYNDTPDQIAIDMQNPDSLPVQGAVIKSTGSSGSTERKINLVRGYPELPTVFDSVIFSKGDLIK